MAEENNDEQKPVPPPPDTPAPTQRQAITEDELIDAVDESDTGTKNASDNAGEDKKAEGGDTGPEPVVERIEFDDFENDRSCTDILCCLIFLVFILGWVAVVALGFIYGRPYSLIYATDYKSNICSRPCTTSDSAICPSNIGSLKLGYYPRVVSDLIEQRATIAKGGFPNFYTLCVNKCPEKGQILCDYDFNAKYNNPLSSSVAVTANIIQCLKITGAI